MKTNEFKSISSRITQVLCAMLFLISAGMAQAGTSILPSNTNILYMGRMDMSNTNLPMLGWPGNTIIASFTGTSISATFTNQKYGFVYALIDGAAAAPSNSFAMVTVKKDFTLIVGTNLANTTHTIRIVKKSEGNDGAIGFKGFTLDTGAYLTNPPAQPSLRFEFYGDSGLAGNSVDSIANNGNSANNDNYYDYCGFLARMFNAQYYCMGFSGIGISNSYAPALNMQQLYNYTQPVTNLVADTRYNTSLWSFNNNGVPNYKTNWYPDVVFILLGANDILNSGTPSTVTNGWINFVQNQLRPVYPMSKTHICFIDDYGWATSETAPYDGPTVAYLKAQGETNVSYVLFPWVYGEQEMVLDEQAGVANIIGQHLAKTLGWATPTPSPFDYNDPVIGQMVNGGFESLGIYETNVPNGWRNGTSGTGAAVAMINNDSHSGNNCIQINTGSKATGYAFWSHSTRAMSNVTYVATAWMKATNAASTTANLRIEFFNEGQTLITQTTNSANVTTNWQQYTSTGIAPAGTWSTRLVTIAGGSLPTNQIIRFDDIGFYFVPLFTAAPTQDTTGTNAVLQWYAYAYPQSKLESSTDHTAWSSLPDTSVTTPGYPYQLNMPLYQSTQAITAPVTYYRLHTYVTNWDNSVSDVYSTNYVAVYAPPVANFSGTPTSGGGPLTATFTDASTGSITNYYWDFGDGYITNVTTVSVSHTYAPGTYAVTEIVSGSWGSGTNIQSSYISVTQTAPVISWSNPADIAYGTPLSGTQLNASCGVAGSFAYTPASGTVLGVGNGQTLSVTFTPTDTVDYTTATASVSINVQKATPVVSWSNPADIVYGTALSGTQLNASCAVLGGFTYTPASGTVLGAGNGQTLSVQFVPVDTADYNTPTAQTVSINVNQAGLTVTANNVSKLYGQNLVFAGTEFTTSGLIGSDSVTSVTLASDGATNTAPVAGSSYSIIASGAMGSGLGNYNITYNPGSLTVNPANLGVTADNQSRIYGAINPEFTVSYSGFVNGESLTNSDVVGASDLSTMADTNSPVGTYDITNLVGSLASTNYTFSLTNGTLTVAVAAITVTADNQSRGYGAVNPNLTASYSGFVNGDDASVISGAPGLSVSADTNSPVGTYTVSTTAGSLSATNYAFTLVNGSLDVTQASLTVTANAASKTYDGLAYSGGNGVSYAGFVNGEDATVLGGTLSYSGTSQGAIAAGSYVITPGGLTSGNYAISYVDGTLTVGQLGVTVTANVQTKVYGTADPALTYQVSPALVSGDSFSGGLTRAAGEAVGSYAIGQGTLLLNSNYQLTFVGSNLSVTPASLTVTANNASKVYGQNLVFAGTEFSTSPLIGSDSVTSVTLTSAGALNTASVNTYDIVPSNASGSGLGNYNIGYVNGTLTVTAATPVTVNQPVVLGNGTVQLTFAGGDAGVNYRIQASTDLAVWSTLFTNLAGTYGLPSFIDTDATNHVLRFYRTVTP